MGLTSIALDSNSNKAYIKIDPQPSLYHCVNDRGLDDSRWEWRNTFNIPDSASHLLEYSPYRAGQTIDTVPKCHLCDSPANKIIHFDPVCEKHLGNREAFNIHPVTRTIIDVDVYTLEEQDIITFMWAIEIECFVRSKMK